MPTPSDETPSTGADTEDERKVEINSEESTEKEAKPKQFATRSKSLGTLSDSKSFFPPHQRLPRRKIEGGEGIRVVWRTSPTAELETLSRVLGIQARNRSVSPMKRPEHADHIFSEYYDPLAFQTRLSSNSQGTATDHLGIPTAKRRNTLKRDTTNMPSVKKLLSIFERSATTYNDPRTPNSELKVLPTKEHLIKFPKAYKNERLNQSMPGIVYDVYGQYRSKDCSEIYEDNAAIAPKPKITLSETYSKPNSENEHRSHNENNNSSNLCNLNHEEVLNVNEDPSRKVDDQMYTEANKVAKPTTSVLLLKQKWESFVKERMKSKKVLKPADMTANDDKIVQPTKQLESKINEYFDKEFNRYHIDTLRRSAPFERNTTSRKSVKNIAKKYESMREGSPHSKDSIEDKNKISALEVKKKITLTPSKSLDNIRLLEKQGDPWTVDIKIQDIDSSEVKKEINASKIDAKEFVGLERKPSVRDLKKKFEVKKNNKPKIVNLSALKKVEPVTDLSPTKLQETELLGLNSSLEGLKIPHEKDTLPINGDTTAKPPTNQVSTVIEQVLSDIYIQSLDGDTKSEQNLEPKVLNTPLYQDYLVFDDIRIKKNELLGSKTVTKKSFIKIELSISPPNPQKKTKLSILPAAALIDDTKLSFPVDKNNYYPDRVDADPKLKEETIENQLSKQENIVQFKRANIQALRNNVDNNVSGGADSTLEPEIKSSQSEKIENVDENCTIKLSSTASPTSNSDSKSATAKTVLITRIDSPALKNSYTENSAEVQTVNIARLAQNKSENLILNVDRPKFDEQTSRALWKKQPTDTKFLYKSEVKKNEDWNDRQLSKQSEVKDKISESEETDTRLNTETVIDKKHRKKNVNVELLGEQPSPKLSSSRIASETTEFSTYKLPETAKTNTNVNKTGNENRHKGQAPLSPSRNQPPVPSERTKYLVSPTNVPESSFYSAYNSISDLKSRLTSDVNNEQVINSEKDLKMDSDNHEKKNVKSEAFSHTYELNSTNLEESLTKDLSYTNSEESLTKVPSKGGSKFRNRKAARRAYTDSVLKHLVNSDISPSRLEVRKDSEIAHPTELLYLNTNLLYRNNLEDSNREVESADAFVNKKSIPPFLVRKSRSKSVTSITLFNKVRELKPDELKFFKDLTPLSVYPNTSSVVGKDRASSVATSSPTSEAQSSLARTSSFERSSMRESQKYRKLHSDEMKFFGLNYTHN